MTTADHPHVDPRRVDEILITTELHRHPSRVPNHRGEAEALGTLAATLGNDPEAVLQRLVELVLDLCGADSAGVSILKPSTPAGPGPAGADAATGDQPGASLRWHAVAGLLAPWQDMTVPRTELPCDEVLRRETVLLMAGPDRIYPLLREMGPAFHETLFVPWHADGAVIGTLWAIHHTPDRLFDAEDARLLDRLSRFAAAAWRTVTALAAAERAHRELERSGDRRLRVALDAAGMGVYSWEPLTDWTDADQRLLGLIGLAPGDTFSLSAALDRYIHPDDRERYEAAALAMLDPAGDGVLAEEVRWIGSDRRERWLAFAGQTFFGGEGAERRPASVIGVVQDVTARRRMEEALRVSEERLRLVIGQARDHAIFTTGTDGRIADWFAGAEVVLGWSATEAVGEPFEMTFTPEDRAAGAPHHELSGAAIDGAAPDVRWHLRRDGTRVFIEGTTTAMRDHDGRLLGFLKIGQDVTGRRQAEEELRNSEERFRTLIQHSADAIQLIAPDGTLLYSSESVVAVLGYHPDEIAGQDVAPYLHPDDAAGVAAWIAAIAATPQGLGTRQYRVRHRDGHWVWLETTIANHLETPSIEALVGNFRDVTGRRLAEEELRTSEERYRTLFESMDQGYCTIEVLFDADDRPVDYRFHEMNPAFVRNTGLTDAIGRRIREMVPGQEQHWFDTYGEVMRSGRSIRFENEAAGLGRWYDVYAFRVGNPGAYLVAVLFEDITGRKAIENDRERARQVAERAVVARDRFLSIGAHELRTPVTSMKGTAELLTRAIRRGNLDQARLDRYAATLLESSERMAALLDDLFDVARLQSSEMGQLEAVVEPTDLSALVRMAVTARHLGRARTRLVPDLTPGPLVLLDAHRIQQVMVNLIDNALKYSPTGGEVRISLRWEADAAVVRVKDQGIGLPGGALESIFEPFNRAPNAAASSIPGMGLGLYICREIVEAHGGRLWAESDGEGAGTTVTLRLPTTPLAGPPDPVSV